MQARNILINLADKNEVVEGSYAELGNFKNNQGGLVGFGDIGKNRLDVDTFTN